MKRLKLSSAAEVRRSLSRVANMVLNGELDPKSANSIIAAANVILSGIRTDDMEQRIAAMEKHMEESEAMQHEGLFKTLGAP